MKKIFYSIVVLLVTNSISNAQIVYNDLNNTIIGSSNTNPVFFEAGDHDSFNYGTMSVQYSANNFIIFTPTAKEGIVANSYSTFIPGLANFKYPKAFTNGACIGGSDNWTDLAYNNSTGEVVYLYLDGLHSSLVAPKLDSNLSKQYVLMKFMSRTAIDSTQHYGWMRVTLNSAASITLHDWVYDETATSPICAGYGLECAPLVISNKIDSLNKLGTYDFNVQEHAGTINWSTSNATLATVDANGVVTANANGVVEIYASVINSPGMCSSVYDTVTLKIYTPDSLVIGADNDTAFVNDYLQMNAYPNALTIGNPMQNVTWGISNTSIATIDVNGKVLGIAFGNVDIYAEFFNGTTTLYDTFTVSVVCPDFFKIPAPNSFVGIFDSILMPTLNGVEWSLSSNVAASFNSDTSAILGNLEGSVKVYAKLVTSCVTTYDTFTVTVTCPSELIVDRISDTVKIGETMQYSVINITSGINWSVTKLSGNATISSEGLLTGVKKGYVDVVVGVDVCPSLTKTISVYVLDPTSINEGISNNIVIYPNPASSIVTFESNNLTSYEILDVLGNIIMTENSNKNKVNVDVSSLSKGIYIVKIYNGNEFSTRRILIE